MANSLAHLGCHRPASFHFFTVADLPKQTQGLIILDQQGVPYLRKIS